MSRFEDLKTDDNYHKDDYGWEYVDIDERRQLQKDPSGKVTMYISPPPIKLSDSFLNEFEKIFNAEYEKSNVLGQFIATKPNP